MKQETRNKIKTSWSWYQQQMFDFAIGWSEINKPLQPFRDALIFTGVLELGGVKFKWWEWSFVYSIISIIIILLGKFLRINGVVKFNNFLQNKENKEIAMITKIAEKLKVDENK